MTEDQAKTKWCPFARVNNGQGYNANRDWEARADSPFNKRSRCIASACMAWRWNEPWTSQTEEGHGGDLVLRLKRKPGEPKLGYCGLAGPPS